MTLLSVTGCLFTLLLLLLLLLRVGNIPQPSPAASRCKSACEALKQLPIDDWRQRQRQEAAWQAPLRQELAALQAEAGEGRV
jgi:hypothetical protein